MGKVPGLGPRGEGWLVLQLAGLAVVGWLGATVACHLTGSVGILSLVAGWVLISMGLVLASAAVWTLRRAGAFSALPRPVASGRLVRSGPYAIVRHPVYSGIVLACLGWSVAHASVAALAATGVLAVVLDLKRRREELWLSAMYPEYAAYSRETRALVPYLY